MVKPAERGIKKIVPPQADQIELRLFGPGYGECAVIHLGANRWIVVDSCIDTKTGNAVVLDYFNEIDVSPEEAVKLIIVSHWHDDHIRGLSSVVSACQSAEICCSSVFTKEEFLNYILSYQRLLIRASTGIDEITGILQNRNKVINAIADRVVKKMPAEGNAPSCSVTTLSPSDKDFDNFLKIIGKLIPEGKQTKTRADAINPNNTAIALWIECGDVKMLLGSDLEEKGDSDSGWSAIVQSTSKPQGLASIFKIPHHGSKTGHHNKVWTDMIIESPITVLSPFHTAGMVLPTMSDVSRLMKYSEDCYITTKYPSPRSNIRRSPSVEHSIRETVGKVRAIQSNIGWVSFRNGGSLNQNKWSIDLSETASNLRDFNISKN